MRAGKMEMSAIMATPVVATRKRPKRGDCKNTAMLASNAAAGIPTTGKWTRSGCAGIAEIALNIR